MTVEELLNQKEVLFRPQGKDFLVHCFNPEHDDSSPSTRVDKVTGVFHCLSCGHKGNLFDLYNEIRDYRTEKVHLLRGKIRDIISSSVGLPMPEGAVPWTRDFRGISGSTFKKLEAFKHDMYEDRLVFPIKDMSGKIVAFCGRHMLSDQSPKYVIDPVEAKLPIYPPSVRPYLGNIILVEGIFDAINLIDKGLTNVACLFGTRTLSHNNINERLLPILLTGARSVTIILDGDTAGQKAAEDLHKLIKQKTKLMVDTVELDEDRDPGSLSQDEVNALKAVLYDKEH